MNSNLNESLYHKVQMRPLEISEKDLARIFEQVRFDPRLMEVATEFIRDFWWSINPLIFNKCLKNNKSPYTVKPALFAIIRNCRFSSDEVKLEFIRWYEKVAAGIKDPNSQLFYIGLYKIGSKSMDREVNESIECFSHFNLFSKDLPFNKGKPGVVKTKEVLLGSRLGSLALEKNVHAMNIKKIKQQKHLTNDEMIVDLKINRHFLSKILNNNLDGITLDYLIKKDQMAAEFYGAE